MLASLCVELFHITMSVNLSFMNTFSFSEHVLFFAVTIGTPADFYICYKINFRLSSKFLMYLQLHLKICTDFFT